MTDKEKIAQIIAEHLCPQGKSHKRLYGSERMCYSNDNFAECEKVSKCVDALIAAGYGNVADWKRRAEMAERAFSKLVHEMYEHGIRPVCDEKFFVESRLKDAAKELAEEGKDD